MQGNIKGRERRRIVARWNRRQRRKKNGCKVDWKVKKREGWLQGGIEGKEDRRMVARWNRRQRREKDGCKIE